METKIVKITNPQDEQILKMGQIIKNGGLVSFPTETVYGLGVNAFLKDAAIKVFEAKGRPSDNPLIVHIPDVSWLNLVAKNVPKEAIALFEKFSPGPLTIILEKEDLIPSQITAGLNTVAVRIPSHPIARALIKAANVPIAAPSSNLSGKPSPTNAEHVIRDMSGKIDAIIDSGNSSIGVESTVIEIVNGAVNILRPGSITQNDLQKVVKNVSVDKHVTTMATKEETVKSPGMKYKHYSPDADVFVVEGDIDKSAIAIKEHLKAEKNQKIKTAVMCYDGFAFDTETVFYMGENNITYAERLFDVLRKADDLGMQKVYAQFKYDEEYGMAVKNRLFKAAAGKVEKV